MDDRVLILLALLPGTAAAHLLGTAAAVSYGVGIGAGVALVIVALNNLGKQYPDEVTDLLHRAWSDDRESPDPTERPWR